MCKKIIKFAIAAAAVIGVIFAGITVYKKFFELDDDFDDDFDDEFEDDDFVAPRREYVPITLEKEEKDTIPEGPSVKVQFKD